MTSSRSQLVDPATPGFHHRISRCVRPAIAQKQLSISPPGRVRYELKTPWRNGTTHVEFEPVDFIAKLAALVPPPCAHLTRFHGSFAPERQPARAAHALGARPAACDRCRCG
jgi:hypothetical protein